MSDSGSPFDPPAVEESGPAFHPSSEEVPQGARIAGIILVLNGLLGLATLSMADQVPGGFMSALFDIGIGGSLIAGVPRFLVWAKIRTVLGAVVYSVIALAGRDYFSAGFQLAFSGGLCLLLFGSAAPARIAVGGMVSGLCMMLAVVGMMGGTIPLLNPYAGQLEAVPGGVVQRADYSLDVPTEWKLRDETAAKRDNPMADVWLVHADTDSHVIVIPERVAPMMEIDPVAFEENVMSNLKSTASAVEPGGRTETTGGVILTTRATVDGMRIDYVHRLFTRGRFGAQIIAFGPEGRLPADTQAVVDSFHYRP